MTNSNKKYNLKTLVVFSGAGISAESGIDTFRDSGGLWEQYKVEDVATPEAFYKHAKLVLDFYNIRRKRIQKVMPNAAHLSLVELEKDYNVHIITQNIDDLHERAGSSSVLHLHGLITQARDENDDHTIYDIGFNNIEVGDLSPQGGQLRPHIVWFGEEVPEIVNALKLVSKADIFIVVGTSLNVYPAAGLAYQAPRNARKYIIDPHLHEINCPKDYTLIQNLASEGVSQLVQQLVFRH
ncbi:MAG: NAD-dependent deacylase [Flavobacteriales bacterium]|nr:NAD-dependent deacylase [Flavobacteriales bacterium]